MKKARIFDNKKRGRGRPPTGIGTLIGLRWHEPELKAIDEWRSRQEDLPSRLESIRRLVEQASNCGYEEIVAFPPAAAEKAPEHTPDPAANFYHQATVALASGLHDAAGCMFRKCLESVTRNETLISKMPRDELDRYRSAWLKQRIAKLKKVNAIPPALGDLADVIKEEGDAAVHDDVLYDLNSAEALRKFTRAFLEHTFTLPAHIKEIRAKP